MESFIRQIKGGFSTKERQELEKQFSSLPEEEVSYITLSIDKSIVGKAAPLGNASEGEAKALVETTTAVENYLLDLKAPFVFKALRDEGYQVQQWYKEQDHPYWLSPIQDKRVLCIFHVMSGKGAELAFKYHNSIKLKPGYVVVFPANYTHSYKIVTKEEDLNLIVTYIDLEDE